MLIYVVVIIIISYLLSLRPNKCIHFFFFNSLLDSSGLKCEVQCSTRMLSVVYRYQVNCALGFCRLNYLFVFDRRAFFSVLLPIKFIDVFERKLNRTTCNSAWIGLLRIEKKKCRNFVGKNLYVYIYHLFDILLFCLRIYQSPLKLRKSCVPWFFFTLFDNILFIQILTRKIEFLNY